MSRKLSRREAVKMTAAVPFLFGLSGSLPAASAHRFAPDSAPPGTRRRALLIGVGQYQRSGSARWCDLNTEPDVYTLRSVLKSRFGFQDEEILCLTTPEDTTKAKIVGAIQTFLTAWARPGDALYFHYSGHGASRYAADGVPYSTLVPHDYREPGDAAGENHITSDDLLRLFGELKKKMIPAGQSRAAGSLFLTFDSCHSGKLVRGEAKIRGENPDLVPPPPTNPKPVRRGEGDTALATPEALGTGFAALYACRYDQSASEIGEVKRYVPTATRGEKEAVGSMGRFTYFLARTLAESTQETTYQDVYALVHGQISAAGFNDQTPDLRGETQFSLFSGTGPKRLTTTVTDWVPDPTRKKPTQLMLGAGKLVGVTAGSTYALYRVGIDPQKGSPVATATVQSVGLMGAVLTPDSALDQKTIYRALETQHKYDNDPLRVSVADIRSHPQGAAIIAKLEAMAQKDVGLLTLTDTVSGSLLAVTRTDTFARTTKKTRDENGNDFSPPGFVIERVQEGTALRVLPDTGDASPEAVADAVSGALKNAGRLRLLSSLTNNDTSTGAHAADTSGIQVVLRLVPCKTTIKTKDGTDYSAFDGERQSAANARGDYQGNESFVLEVENVGSQKAFLTILDLSPDGTINPVYPPANAAQQAYDPAILAGAKRRLAINGEPYVITMSKPYGSEALKLIATRDEMDFTPLLSPPGTRGPASDRTRRAEETPLGQLFQEVDNGKRGMGTVLPANDRQWCTGTIRLKVSPPTP